MTIKMETYHKKLLILKRGRCHKCHQKCEDLFLFKGKYLCRDCLCPDYDPHVIENLAMEASRRKWGGI